MSAQLQLKKQSVDIFSKCYLSRRQRQQRLFGRILGREVLPLRFPPSLPPKKPCFYNSVIEVPTRPHLLWLMAVHQNRKKDALILSSQMLTDMQMIAAGLRGREGFALWMFLCPILGILCMLGPSTSCSPLGQACVSVGLPGMPRIPLSAPNGECMLARVLSGCVPSWPSWPVGTNVAAQGAVFLCGLHLWHLMGLRGVEL